MKLTLCNKHTGEITTAELTCTHPASSYGQAVIVLPDGEALGTADFALNYRAKQGGATDQEHQAAVAAMTAAGYLSRR